MKKNCLRLQLLQISSFAGQPLRTLKNLEKLLAKKKIKRGDWLVLPELWPSSFIPNRSIFRQRAENAVCFHWLKNFAREKQCYFVGAMLELPKNRAYDSAFLINPQGELQARYRKIHLFRLMGEDKKYSPGNKIQLATLPWGKLGLAICFDLRFPEMFRRMMRRGAKMIIVPSAWPRERIPHFLALLQARAIENQCFMVGVNKCGKEAGGVVFGGHSVVFDPWGRNLGEMGAHSGILPITIDMGRVTQIRKAYPFLKDLL